jgi:hypothetical protein
VPGQSFLSYEISDFLGRSISLEEAKKAVSMMVEDPRVITALQDKTHTIRISSDAANLVTVSSNVLVLDEGFGFRNYVQAKVDVVTSTVVQNDITAITIDQAKSVIQATKENSMIKQSLEKMGVHDIAVEPVQDNGKVLRVLIEPFTGKGKDVRVDLQSRAVLGISDR